MAVGVQQQQRRDTEANWVTSGKILAAGEIGYATDSHIIKMGDGVNTWNSLTIPYDGRYLPMAGKAADSEMLDGISSAGFLLVGDAAAAATAGKVILRDGSGRGKVVAAAASGDIVEYDQLNTALTDNKKEVIVRTVTAATTVATTDVSKMVLVNHSSLTAQVVVTIPTNANAAIPVGSWVDICAIGNGGVKLTPAGGVTLNSVSNVFPNYGLVRILKTNTDEWLGIAISSQRQCRLPKVRAIRSSTGSYTNGSYVFVPYNSLDSSVDFYNPDNEWFDVPASGLGTGRRVMVKKDGEYLAVANFISSTGSQTYTRINLMVADNTLTGGRVLAQQPTLGYCNLSARVRVAAGQSLGVSHLTVGGAGDVADGDFDYRNDFTITRIGD